jgi:hypothetical protein
LAEEFGGGVIAAGGVGLVGGVEVGVGRGGGEKGREEEEGEGGGEEFFDGINGITEFPRGVFDRINKINRIGGGGRF